MDGILSPKIFLISSQTRIKTSIIFHDIVVQWNEVDRSHRKILCTIGVVTDNRNEEYVRIKANRKKMPVRKRKTLLSMPTLRKWNGRIRKWII